MEVPLGSELMDWEKPMGLAVTGGKATGNAARDREAEMQTFHSDADIVVQL